MTILNRSFKGGIHPAQHKDTSGVSIETISAPPKVYIHLFQGFGRMSKPVVNEGDSVRKGTVIAEPDGKISSYIHSPVSGRVEGIKKWAHCSGRKLEAVIIENDFKDEVYSGRAVKDSLQLTSSRIVEVIRRSGVTGLGGAAFPTDVKLVPPPGKKISTLIVNGCECEPYITGDERVLIENPDAVVEGARIAARALAAKDIIIAVEDNKKESASEITGKQDVRLSVAVLPTKYPQGGEKQLIYTLLGRTVPVNGLPADAGCVVINLQTAVAIYNAVVTGRPLIDRVVTLGGFFRKPGNVRIPVGMRLEDIINFRGGMPDGVHKIIFGGPMMGTAVNNIDVPVAKATSSILLLPVKEPASFECIRCLRCSSVCPMNLSPWKSYALRKRNKAYKGAQYCIECASCAYICPAGIPLVHYLKWAKAELKTNASESKRIQPANT